MVKLTPEQCVVKDWIEKIRKEQEALGKKLLYIIVVHEEEGHVIIPQDPNIIWKLKTNKWASTWAYCVICKKDFG